MIVKRTAISIVEYKKEEDGVNGVDVIFTKSEKDRPKNYMVYKPEGHTIQKSRFISEDEMKSSTLSKEELIKNAIVQLANDIQKGE